MTVRTQYLAACSAVDDLVQALEAADWDRPGLPGWTVRDLTGHTSRAMVTVLTYLARPGSTREVTSPVDYVLHTATVDPGQVADRGRQAGRDLGGDPAAEFGALTHRVRAALDQPPNDVELIETLAGGMRIGHYLPTRTPELVVHGHDLALATGRAVGFPNEVVTDALDLLSRIAVVRGQTDVLLRALTGRGPLPVGFTVL